MPNELFAVKFIIFVSPVVFDEPCTDSVLGTDPLMHRWKKKSTTVKWDSNPRPRVFLAGTSVLHFFYDMGQGSPSVSLLNLYF